MFDQNTPSKPHQGYESYIFTNEKKSSAHYEPKSLALTFFLKNAKPHKIKARHMVARQAEMIHYHYVVKEGVIRLVKHLNDGRRQIIGFCLPGDLIGQYFRAQWPFDVEAATPLILYQLSKKNIDAIITVNPKLALNLYKTTAHELGLYHEHIIRLTSHTADEKICRFLLDLHKRWHLINPDDPLFIPMPMTRQDIADYLGLTFETVSRLLNRMQKNKIINIFSNGLEIIQADFFEKYQSDKS